MGKLYRSRDTDEGDAALKAALFLGVILRISSFHVVCNSEKAWQHRTYALLLLSLSVWPPTRRCFWVGELLNDGTTATSTAASAATFFSSFAPCFSSPNGAEIPCHQPASPQRKACIPTADRWPCETSKTMTWLVRGGGVVWVWCARARRRTVQGKE